MQDDPVVCGCSGYPLKPELLDAAPGSSAKDSEAGTGEPVKLTLWNSRNRCDIRHNQCEHKQGNGSHSVTNAHD